MKPYHPPHIYLAGYNYFITGSTFDKLHLWDTDEKKFLLRDLLKKKIEVFDLKLYAWVILTNHYHLLMRNNERDAIWKFIKELHGASATALNKLDNKPGRKVWRNYWDYCPRNEKDFYGTFNYIHLNPWKHAKNKIQSHCMVEMDGKVIASEARDMMFLDSLASISCSSFQYYLKKHGHEAMWDYFRQYPVLKHWDRDDF